MDDLRAKVKEAQADKDRLEVARSAHNQEMRLLKDRLDELIEEVAEQDEEIRRRQGELKAGEDECLTIEMQIEDVKNVGDVSVALVYSHVQTCENLASQIRIMDHKGNLGSSRPILFMGQGFDLLTL